MQMRCERGDFGTDASLGKARVTPGEVSTSRALQRAEQWRNPAAGPVPS